jgi:hypothetical protein
MSSADFSAGSYRVPVRIHGVRRQSQFVLVGGRIEWGARASCDLRARYFETAWG